VRSPSAHADEEFAVGPVPGLGGAPANERLRNEALILRAVSEGLILQDADGRIVEWNPAAEAMLGLTGEQLVGRRPKDARWTAVHLDGTAWAGETPCQAAVRTGEPVRDVTMGFQWPSGRHVWLRVNSDPIFDDAGHVTQVVSACTDITGEIEAMQQRRVAEQALVRGEKTARVSLDALEQGVVLATLTGSIVRINPAAERILGYPADQLAEMWKARNWETYDEHGEVLIGLERPVVRAVVTGQAVIGQIVGWRRGDGSRILMRLSVVPNADDADGLVLSFTDVTNEHQANRLLDTTLETAPVGIAVLDFDGTIVRCNTTFGTHTGRTQEELIGVKALTLLVPEARPAAADVANRVRAGETPRAQFDQRVDRPDGVEMWVNVHVTVIPDPDRPLGVVATFDVTERRRMMQELDRFKHLFRHSNDLVTVIDATGYVLYTSPSSVRILGYPHGYRHPMGVLGLVHPDDRATIQGELESLLDGTRADEPFTTRVIRSDGDVRHMECLVTNLLDEPAVRGIMITARDVTERVQLTEQLARLALHDPLTELPNRQLLTTAIEAALDNQAKTGRRVGLCFIDLDGFKRVNDAWGHAVGDQLIRSTADRLRQTVRMGDLAARIGGDEFVVLLDGVDGPEQAEGIARRIHDALIAPADDDSATCGASIGVAVSVPGDTASALLRRADAAMYTAKSSESDKICVEPG
jgi:diguanylate cyclase (GGDEF)-like protein/PAS domain S-box-containing protein